MVRLQRTHAPRNLVSDSPVSLLLLSGCEEGRGGAGITYAANSDPAAITTTNGATLVPYLRGNAAAGPITASSVTTSAPSNGTDFAHLAHRLSRYPHNTQTQTVAAHNWEEAGMLTHMNLLRLLWLFPLAILISPQALAMGVRPDFSICQGLRGPSAGLCIAGTALGCVDDNSRRGCARIEERFEVVAGEPAPWVNMTPNADAGEDQKVKINTLANLDGSGSSDPDGDDLSYMWTLTSAPTGSNATLVSGDTVSPMLTPDVGGVYIVSLVVNDGTVDSAAVTTTITAGFLLPEYDALGLFTNCSWTYEFTVGPDTGQQFTTSTSGVEDVNYVTETLTGTVLNNVDNAISIVTFNDGQTLKLLRFDDIYLSSDCSMTSHPDSWSLDIVYSGLRRDFDGFSIEVGNPANCQAIDDAAGSHILFDIQDVTVNGTLYRDAIVQWWLDAARPYTLVSPPVSLGILPPTSEDTQGDSVTDVTILGLNTGVLSQIGVDADTGTVDAFGAYELLAAPTCN